MTHEGKLQVVEFGAQIAWGFVRVIATGVLIFFGFTLAFRAFGPIDDSDFDKWHRSGLEIHTDALSGRQYLVTPGGGITPRLDVDGRQVIRPEADR